MRLLLEGPTLPSCAIPLLHVSDIINNKILTLLNVNQANNFYEKVKVFSKSNYREEWHSFTFLQ
jgi:hypothetical protein